jgi:hypothetical protein
LPSRTADLRRPGTANLKKQAVLEQRAADRDGSDSAALPYVRAPTRDFTPVYPPGDPGPQLFELAGRYVCCEARLNRTGDGYELRVVGEDDEEHVERFRRAADLFAREHELLTTWRAMGWHRLDRPRSRAR